MESVTLSAPLTLLSASPVDTPRRRWAVCRLLRLNSARRRRLRHGQRSAPLHFRPPGSQSKPGARFVRLVSRLVRRWPRSTLTLTLVYAHLLARRVHQVRRVGVAAAP